MSAHRQAIRLVVLAVALAASLGGGRHLLAPAAAGAGDIPRERVDATFTFEASVTPADRQTILAAVAAARPEAQALIARVDGLVTLRVGPPPGGTAGLTEGNLDGYTVTLDLAAVYQRNGTRGINRLVLHELGHVVDHALLTPERRRALDAGIPAGYACGDEAQTSACAPRAERFAETFAKWAVNDIGVNIWLGYKVMPPPSLDDWGHGLDGVLGSES